MMRICHKLARTVVSVLSAAALALSLCPFGQAFANEPGGGQPSELTGSESANVAKSVSAVYVGAAGSDESGNGTQDRPYASLAKAVDQAPDGAVIYVMSDLTMSECARFYNKSLTITSAEGGPYTLSRAEGFATISDPARSWYNPALIEVGNTDNGQVPAKLTLSNIVLDDGFRNEGEYFIQAASKGGGTDFGNMLDIDNKDIVQDAMVATYAKSATITLGYGAVLQNYGGMSAVRVAGGSLVMQSGSVIRDSESYDRSKGTKIDVNDQGMYGPAGAVWCQGGSVTLDQGSEIQGIGGRAIYLDGGSAAIDGTLSDVKSDGDMWWGTSGFFLHLRGGADATIGEHGVVDGGGIETSGSAIEVPSGCSLSTEQGSVVKDVNKGTAITVNGSLEIAGEITGCRGWAHAIAAQADDFYIRIEPSGSIHDNQCFYGTIYAQGSNGVIDIYGAINDNVSNDRGGAIAMANNFGPTKVNMYAGAEICRNVSYQTGGGIMVSRGIFTMYGGTISDNVSGVGNVASADKVGGGVFVRRGGQFVMSGGEVSDNSAAGIGGNIALQADDYEGITPFVRLDGGTVVGGTMNADIAGDDESYTASGGVDNDVSIVGGDTYGKVSRYLSISDGVQLSEQSIYMGDYGFYVENPRGDVKLGNASSKAEEKATEAYRDSKLTEIVASFWFQSDRAAETFVASDLEMQEGKPVYAAVIPTDESGMPASGMSPNLVPTDVGEDGTVSATISGTGANGQAVVFLQEGNEDAKIVSITPADLTAYMGGEHGYTYVDGEGEVVELSSIPTPGFRVQCPEGWNIGEMRLTATVGSEDLVWRFEPYSEGSTDVYKIVPDGTKGTQVKVEFVDESGAAVDSDAFAFDESLGQELVMRVYGEGVGENDIKASFGGQSGSIASGTGILTVRGTTQEEEYAFPNGEIQKGKPGLKVPAGTEYAINGGDSQVASTDGVALLFDGIIETNGETTNADLLRSHAENSLFAGDPGDREYEFKYLDLVDRNNGNVWVKASEPVTVCWPIPERAGSNTEYSIVHFEGLHREMGVGLIEDEIERSVVKEIDCTVVGDHVEFQVEPGNFSPFALVWTEKSGSVTPPRPQTVTLHYETNGGRPIADEEYAVGAKATLKNPLREGCTFVGWYLDPALTRPAENPLTMDSDKTVWAKWKSTSVPADFVSAHVNYVLGREIEEGRFVDPESNVTRAEVAAMFYRLLDEDVRNESYRETSTFSDVEEGAWYEIPIATLQAMGIIKGDEGMGTCRPDDQITRAEFAAMAGRFDDDGEWPDMEPFADMEGHWAERIVLVAAENGWILGDENSDKFRPDDPITRAETFAIMNRVLQRIPESESDLLPGRIEWPDNQNKDKWYWLVVEEATNSHDHTMKEDGIHERWIALLENEDWS